MLSIIVYAIIGGILFSILGVLATYTRSETPTAKTIGRDWAAGIVITGVLRLINPSLMPPIDAVEKIMSGGGSGSSGSSKSVSFSDYPLQIGIQPGRY